jgi:hypothetical protein
MGLAAIAISFKFTSVPVDKITDSFLRIDSSSMTSTA